MRAPLNTLVHGRDTPDTLRSVAWLDLAAGPVVLTVPDTCGRYYALWLTDDADNVFASIGPRTTGTGPGAFGLLGPPWNGAHLPPGITPIASPTSTPRVVGCIEAAGERDEDALRRAYDGFRLAPLTDAPPAAAPAQPLAALGATSRPGRSGDGRPARGHPRRQRRPPAVGGAPLPAAL